MGAHRADDFVRDPGEMDGEALGFGFQEKRNTEFGGADDDGWGKQGSGRHTGREPCLARKAQGP